MSLFLQNCLQFSSHLTSLLDGSLCKAVDPKDDGTVFTDFSDDDFLLDEKACTIQAYARGFLVRKNMESLEQATLHKTRKTLANNIIMDEIEKSSSNSDIDECIRKIKNLLKTNEELWNRCKGNLCGERGAQETKFTRVSYPSVQVSMQQKGRVVRFSTKVEQMESMFDTKHLATVPDELKGIFEVKYDEFCFVDFRSILERALLLHDYVLLPFLFKLKLHLEAVSISLVVINNWLDEPSAHVQFINNTFGSNLKLPEDREIQEERSAPKIVHECELSSRQDFKIEGIFGVMDKREQRILKKVLTFVSSG